MTSEDIKHQLIIITHTHTRIHGGDGEGVSKGKRTAHGRDKAVGRHSGTDTELQMACISGKCREGWREAVEGLRRPLQTHGGRGTARYEMLF